MRLNTLFKILGLTAVLALPLALVGCDDDDTTPGTDAAAGDGSADTAVGDTNPGPKLDAAPKLDSGSDAAAGDAQSADAGDASTNG